MLDKEVIREYLIQERSEYVVWFSFYPRLDRLNCSMDHVCGRTNHWQQFSGKRGQCDVLKHAVNVHKVAR